MPAHRIPIEIRFWTKVKKSEDCWLWTGATSGDGYGHIKIDGRMIKAHRVGFELAGGTIPDGMDLDHLCRTPLCVRADHLEPVARRENVLRGDGPTARHSRQTHCEHGHEFSPENTYVYPSGLRACRACHRRYRATRGTSGPCSPLIS